MLEAYQQHWPLIFDSHQEKENEEKKKTKNPPKLQIEKRTKTRENRVKSKTDSFL